ncbi:MAG: acyl transferase [Chitinophagaceae bacterium]|nr:acyl transferase [Chitinophagaceae bacterium]
MFHFQYQQNKVYKEYVDSLHRIPDEINSLETIPFLPISFFKSHEVTSTTFEPEAIFESSGTTGQQASRHLVRKWKLYEKSFMDCFTSFYGEPHEYCIIGLLPGYLERQNSSLVAMTDTLIRASHNRFSGFYLDDYKKVYQLIAHNEFMGTKTLLLGVTFALLDFAAQFRLHLKKTTIMETGGMKGRRKEMIREEVHQILKDSFGVEAIHSEYGMTELLSQAYSSKNGIFKTPYWMKICIRDPYDPLRTITAPAGYNSVSGLINVIDLANKYSCSFIATEDIGKLYHNGTFEVLGRSDTSLVRGCNLLVV